MTLRAVWELIFFGSCTILHGCLRNPSGTSIENSATKLNAFYYLFRIEKRDERFGYGCSWGVTSRSCTNLRVSNIYCISCVNNFLALKRMQKNGWLVGGVPMCFCRFQTRAAGEVNWCVANGCADALGAKQARSRDLVRWGRTT